MCTLAIYFRVSAELPLVVAANRDEFYARPATAPQMICHDPWVVAGLDLNAGGTWLGLNANGMVAGLLNRRNPAGPDPQRRSRGLLCLEMLQAGTPQGAIERLRAERGDSYNWFNLLLADRKAAFVATNVGDRISVQELEPGLHLLTNLEVNDPTCPRIAKSYRLFAGVSLPATGADLPALLERLRTILADHAVPLDPRLDPAGNTLCVHSPSYGTRSSTIIVADARGVCRFFHADGAPCTSAYQEVELPR